MGNNILSYLLESSIVLLIMYGLYYFLFRTLKNFMINRFYLLFVLASSLIIPLLSFKMYPVYLELTNAPAPRIDISDATALAATVPSYDLFDYAFFAYLLVAVILLIKLLTDLGSVLGLAFRNDKTMKDDISLIINDRISGVQSFFNFIFCKDPNELTDEVLSHEKVHIDQLHSLDIVLVELGKCLLWFNPIIYLLRRSIKLNHEFICDQHSSQIYGIDAYSQLMITKGTDPFRFNIKNDFSMLIKNRLIMLFNKDDNKRLWRYFLIVPLLFCLLSLYSFDTYYIHVVTEKSQVDTLPDLKVITKTTVDTVAVFDAESGEEKIVVVKNNAEYVEMIDTMVVFDASTYTEKLSIKRTEIPIQDYYKKRAENRFNKYSKALQEEMSMNNYRVDTIAFKEYNTGVMITSVVHKINDCYTFLWGDYAFSDSHRMPYTDFQKILNSSIRLDKTYNKECTDISEFSFRVVVISEAKDPMVFSLNNSRNKISPMLLDKDYLSSSSKLFIEDIRVNGEKVLNGIVISLY